MKVYRNPLDTKHTSVFDVWLDLCFPYTSGHCPFVERIYFFVFPNYRPLVLLFGWMVFVPLRMESWQMRV